MPEHGLAESAPDRRRTVSIRNSRMASCPQLAHTSRAAAARKNRYAHRGTPSFSRRSKRSGNHPIGLSRTHGRRERFVPETPQLGQETHRDQSRPNQIAPVYSRRQLLQLEPPRRGRFPTLADRWRKGGPNTPANDA